MAIRLESVLLCDLIVVGPDRKFQLQGIFDRIFSTRLPIRHGRAFVYFRFYTEAARQDSQHELKLSLSEPDGQNRELATTRVKVGSHGKVEGYIQLVGLPLSAAGVYRLRLRFDEQEIGSYLFEVTIVPAAPSSSGSDMVH